MVIYNAATRELTAKIVYYGPGLCGKTTNLKVLHDRLEPGTAGKLLNLQTQTDRTIYFDLLPVELGDIKGYKIRFQLATVPGQTAFNETRRVVLKGVDGIVFVADSQWTMLPKNLEAWQNLKDNLKVNSITFESIPVVIQYNKRDLADILAVDAMQEALGLSSYPFVEAVASAGRGVTETFKLISKLTFVDLLRRLQGRRAEEEALESARAAEELTREDDLQTWKDSLLKRESQPAVAVSRPSRPLSLVPPVLDEAPFDTTELSRGVDDDESDSPYSVPAPPGMGMTSEPEIPELANPAENPAATVRMDAVGFDFDAPPSASPDMPPPEDEAPEVLSEADEIPNELGLGLPEGLEEAVPEPENAYEAMEAFSPCRGREPERSTPPPHPRFFRPTPCTTNASTSSNSASRSSTPGRAASGRPRRDCRRSSRPRKAGSRPRPSTSRLWPKGWPPWSAASEGCTRRSGLPCSGSRPSKARPAARPSSREVSDASRRPWASSKAICEARRAASARTRTT